MEIKQNIFQCIATFKEVFFYLKYENIILEYHVGGKMLLKLRPFTLCENNMVATMIAVT